MPTCFPKWASRRERVADPLQEGQIQDLGHGNQSERVRAIIAAAREPAVIMHAM
jgi:hypothetical protein